MQDILTITSVEPCRRISLPLTNFTDLDTYPSQQQITNFLQKSLYL